MLSEHLPWYQYHRYSIEAGLFRGAIPRFKYCSRFAKPFRSYFADDRQAAGVCHAIAAKVSLYIAGGLDSLAF